MDENYCLSLGVENKTTKSAAQMSIISNDFVILEEFLTYITSVDILQTNLNIELL